ncbi:MAG TPA: beta-mannosidase, partial [Catalimonadaceae bacterium]|nr:beta-mannosidase [Catalimonadaceae bacterium]
MTLPKIIKAIILFLLALPGIQGDLIAQKSGFVTTRNGRFLLDSKEYHFIGVNYWCAAILGMEKPPGDRMRLNNELDFLAKN